MTSCVSKGEGLSFHLHMEGGEFQRAESSAPKFSILLELSALDDCTGFKNAIEQGGHDVNESGFWYSRRIGSRKMALDERKPLMIAAMYGSKRVLSYILEKGVVDVNQACGSDGVTALHCAVAGSSDSSCEVVKLLLDACADVDLVDADGNRPADLISRHHICFKSRRKMLLLLSGNSYSEEEVGLIDEIEVQQVFCPTEKKDFPVDPSLPDMNEGVYQTDEFRMYVFKVKPCSRAYSHDWTECPFVHPGENARRRDPRKYHYSCVPCPDFKIGACHRGDACEYAHGIFECWLHPAQYRTRMCKDEERCKRRVCFFAHKPEELRPLYASTGSGMPSPRSFSISASPYDFPSVILSSTSTPPMTASGASSPINGSMRPNQLIDVPPILQLPGSRLKSEIHARDVDFDGPTSGFSSPSWRNNNFNSAFFVSSTDQNRTHCRNSGIEPTNLDDRYESIDPKILSALEELSLDAGQLHQTNGLHFLQNLNKHRQASYESSLPSSPRRLSAANAASVLTTRSAAFAKRSWSFTDRSPANHLVGSSSPFSHAPSSALSNWGSPDGKLNWGIQGEELNKLKKSASFGARNDGKTSMRRQGSPRALAHEHEVSWGRSSSKHIPSPSDSSIFEY